MDDIYSNETIPGFKYPNPKIAVVSIAGGVATLALCLFWVLYVLSFYIALYDWGAAFAAGARFFRPVSANDFVDLGYNLGVVGIIASSGIYAVFGGLTILRIAKEGWRSVASGGFALMATDYSGQVPRNFSSANAVARAMENREVYANGDLGPLANTVYGHSIIYLSPAAGSVAKPILNDLQRGIGHYAKPVIVAALIIGSVFALRFALQNESNSALRAVVLAVDLGALINWVLFPALVVLAGFLAVGVLKHFIIRLLAPKGAPRADVSERSEQARAAMPPRMLADQIKNLYSRIQWKGFANRYYSLLSEQKAVSISDSGEFEIRMLIERQPESRNVQFHRCGFLTLCAGWGLRLMGLLILIFLVLPKANPATIQDIGDVSVGYVFLPIYVVIALWAVSHLLTEGSTLQQSGRRLLNSNWFQAPIVYLKLRGNLSKGQARVGKAVDESLETTTEYLRSDFLYEAYGAEVVSEVEGIDGDRYQIAMFKSETSEKWLKYAEDVIKHLSSKRVQTTAIDLDDDAAREMVQANMAAQAQKAQLIKAAKLTAEQEHKQRLAEIAEAKTKQLPDQSGEQG